MTDKVQKILAKIESLLYETNYEPFTDEVFGRIQSLKELKSYIDSLQEEPVSEDLDEAARHYLLNEHKSPLNTVFHNADIKSEMQYHTDIENAYKAGVKWMANQ